MKKIFLAACCLILVGACNKNKKLNEEFIGTWTSTLEGGLAVVANDSSRVTFLKTANDQGKITIITFFQGKQNSLTTGTYKISDKGKTLAIDAEGNTSASSSSPSYAFSYKSNGGIDNLSKTHFKYNATVNLSSSGLSLSNPGTFDFLKR